jgi:hypothetical protein
MASSKLKMNLGWADFRLTDYESIERWWEVVFSAYLLVSIQANYFQLETVKVNQFAPVESFPINSSLLHFSKHPCWEAGITWKSALNNLRLIIQPLTFYNLIRSWWQIFNLPGMRRGFVKLIKLMNEFQGFSFQKVCAQDNLLAVAC